MDTGFKPIVRGVRKAIKKSFYTFVKLNQYRFKQNRYRWTDEEYEAILRAYMLTLESPYLRTPTNEAVWIVGLLVYPNKGIFKPKIACEPLFHYLGEEGIH